MNPDALNAEATTCGMIIFGKGATVATTAATPFFLSKKRRQISPSRGKAVMSCTILKDVDIQADYGLRVMTCGTCGVIHAIPVSIYENCLNEGGFWHCPNGHSRGWGKGTLQSQLDKEKQRRQWAEEAEADRRADIAALNKQLSAQKAATTKAKKRHAAAVCPCCNRSFVQLRRHMKSQHPDYDPGGGR